MKKVSTKKVKVATRVDDRRLVDFKLLDAGMLEIIRELMAGYYEDQQIKPRRMPWLR